MSDSRERWRKVDSRTVRQLAAECDVDVQTVRKVAETGETRYAPSQRVLEAMKRRGIA